MTARVRRLCVTVFAVLPLASGLLALPALAAAATPGYFGVDFISDNSGWVVGTDTTVLATANGGKAWQVQATTPGGAALLDVCVLPDGQTGWAVGAPGTVLRTSDGKAWARCSLRRSTRVQLHVGQFVDAKIGWISGGVAAGPMQGLPRGAVLATTDGGATWWVAAVFSGWCPVALEAVSATSAVCAGIQRVRIGRLQHPGREAHDRRHHVEPAGPAARRRDADLRGRRCRPETPSGGEPRDRRRRLRAPAADPVAFCSARARPSATSRRRDRPDPLRA